MFFVTMVGKSFQQNHISKNKGQCFLLDPKVIIFLLSHLKNLSNPGIELFPHPLLQQTCPASLVGSFPQGRGTLQGTNISPKNRILKMIFLFPRWDMLVPWRVYIKQKSLKPSRVSHCVCCFISGMSPHVRYQLRHMVFILWLIFCEVGGRFSLLRSRESTEVQFRSDPR